MLLRHVYTTRSIPALSLPSSYTSRRALNPSVPLSSHSIRNLVRSPSTAPHRTATPRSTARQASTMAPIPKNMSGILIEENGGVDVLKWKTDLPVPQPQDGEILVRNEFVGVNYIDTYFRTGLYKAPLPLVTGKEAAGVVVASSSPAFKEGDRVGYVADHAYAELTAVPATKAIKLPDGISTETAASALLQGLTALTFVREAAGIKQALGVSEGPWTLVHAAAGGTGSLLVQILSVFGAKVIGTAGSPEKCEIARKNGAQWTIDNRKEDVAARVKEITSGHGVDVIFDGVGKATFDLDLEIIARKGTLIVFGNASGPAGPVDLFQLAAKNIKLMRPVVFNYTVTPEEWEGFSNELFDLIKTGKLKLGIHNTYALKDVAQAHSDLEGRKSTGKLLLKV
ncbi:quinone oxidoreductase [Echria macrotheca]|uniref:Probable quinone oxidoreductase n=1 Tax=Echria macrotheca TaxID=438768 RepID=A0AAJ0BCS7_9PEZI|nr:quinone oxidoreductase [Echria macrotheca]